MARRKSLAQLQLQRYRIINSGASASRMQRVNDALSRYTTNIYRSQGIRNINPVTNFLNGSVMKARTVQVSRSTYMGLNAG